MADKKSGAYGTSAGGDTDFRKTYDREEYARRAKEREEKEREEGKARYEAKLQGKTYRRAITPPDVKDTEARSTRFDPTSMIGKTMLVPAGAGVGKRGRSAGIYCEACDLTFKNNIEFVEHQNTRGHLLRVGESGDVKRATVKDVHERLRWLSRKRREESKVEELDLDKRLEKRKEEEEREREEKRRKRNEKRRAKKEPEW